MKKKKFKFNTNVLFLMIVIIIFLIFIFGKEDKEEIEVVEEVGDSQGSGILTIESIPSGADIFLDNAISGTSPVTLYNIPAGSHNIAIKKIGYEDFTREVSVEAGKRTDIEVSLVEIKPFEEKVEVVEIEDEGAETAGIIEEKEEISTEFLEDKNIVNIGNKFLLYYDFSEREFTNNKQLESDVFSKRYNTYLVFTRSNPANIKAIDKNIGIVKKEDCIGIKGQFEFLHSGKSLCVITKENQIVAIGGNWLETENADLIWKVFD